MKLSKRERLGASLLATVAFVGVVAALALGFVPRWFLSDKSRPAAMWVAIAIGLFYQVQNWLRESAKDEEDRQDKERDRQEKRQHQEAVEARERQEREAKEAAERAATEAAEQRRLARFKPCSLSCEIDGEMVHVAWGGPVDDLPEEDPRPMTPALVAALFPALGGHKVQRLTPYLRDVRDLKDPLTVYAVDAGFREKRKLQSTAAIDYGSVLRVELGRSAGLSYCPRCGRISTGGDNCADCPHREGGELPGFKPFG